MNLDGVPLIRIEVERMRAAIINHLGVAGSQLGEFIGAEVQRAIESFPWKERVEEVTHDVISEAIEQHFRYGPGRKVIDKAIDDALTALK